MIHAALHQRTDQCPNGHPYVEGSYVVIHERGYERLRCRICHAAQMQAARARHASARAARYAANRLAADIARRAMKPARLAEAQRPCLRCHRLFKSSHCGNRLCTGCLKL